jgi:hypothetical protein
MSPVVRTYQHGQIVGEREQPIPTRRWLTTEIAHAQKLMDEFDCRPGSRIIMNIAYVNGRLQALKETLAQLEANKPVEEL